MARFELEGILKLVDVQINQQVFAKISRAVANLPVSLSVTAKTVKTVNQNVTNLNQNINKTSNNINNMSKAAQLFLQRMAQFAVLLPTFATLNHLIQGGAKFLGDFESIIIDIQRVDLDRLRNQFDEIAGAALLLGQRYGASAKEVAESIKTFIQAGDSLETSLEKTKVATLASKVTTLALADAQEVLIASSEIFKGKNLEAVDVMDKLAKVEDISALNAQDIADAWRTGGNALAFATKSIDDMNALVAALAQQTRKSGREVGTFFKTLSTRILAAGESKAAVEALGVQVEDLATGQLRPLLPILQDLKIKFEQLTEAEQATAAKAIAGVRQFESFLATLQSLDNAQRFSAASAEAQGTLLEKQKITAEKLNIQIQSLIASLEGLAFAGGDNGLLNLFKQLVASADLFTKALSSALSVMNELGLSITPLLAIGTIKLGSAIFGKGNQQGPAAIPGLNVSNTGARSIQTNNMVVSGRNVGIPNNSVNSKAIIALGAAAIVAEAGLSALAGNLNSSSPTISSFIKNIGSAASMGIQFGAAFGKTAGLIATAASFVVSSFKEINDAAKTGSMAVSELNSITKKEAELNRSLPNKGGPDFAVSVIDAIASAFKGKGKDELGKAFNEAFKQIGALKDVGLSTGDTRDLILSSKEFLASLAAQKKQLDDTNPAHQRYIEVLNKLQEELPKVSNAGQAFRVLGEAASKFEAEAKTINETLSDLTGTFEELKKVREIKDIFFDIGKLGFEIQRIKLSPEDALDGFADLKLQAKEASAELDNVTSAMGQFIETSRRNAIGLNFNEDQIGQLITELFNVVEKSIKSNGKNIEDDFNKLFSTFKISSDPQKEFLKNIGQEFLTFKTASVEAQKALKEVDLEIFRRTADANNVLRDAQEKYNETLVEGQIATLKFGSSLSNDVLNKLANLSFEEFGKIISGISDVPSTIQNAVKAIAGTDAEKESFKQGAASEEAAIRISLLNDKLKSLSGETDKINKIEDERIRSIKLAELEAKKQEVQAQIVRTTQEQLVKAAESRIQSLDAEQKALEDAEKAERARLKLVEKLKDAEEDLNKALRKSSEEFRNFIESSRQDLLDQETDARANLANAEQDVLSATKSLSDAYKAYKETILSVSDSLVSAKIQSDLFGRTIATLNGEIFTFAGRLSSLDEAFSNSLRDANISLQQRIELERQLAQETLTFLQQAQSEIVGAGLQVFGQSPEENQALREGISGLEMIAEKFGGSFEKFLTLSESQIESIGQQLLNLPVEFRKKILDALGSLPSSVNIGGFSADQLEQVVGQIGAGIAPGVGLPGVGDLTEQQIQQLEKLQDLALKDGDLQLSQLIAAKEQLKVSELQLEAAKIQSDRAREDLGAVRDAVTNQAILLTEAQALQKDLTNQIISSQDRNALQSITRQAELFSESNQNARAIKDELVSAIVRLAEAQERKIEASNALSNNARGFIPNFAKGNLSPKEASGLLFAAKREKRLMPAGASLAVANTSEAIIPMRNKGFIPNFAGGSEIASGIEAARGINETVVAAIARSISVALSEIRTGGSDEEQAIFTQVVDELRSINEGITSLSNANIALSQTLESSITDTGSNAGSVDINLNTNQQNSVAVTGLERLADEIRVALERQVQSQIDQQMVSINESIRQLFRVLRERGLISSFGQV